MTEVRIFSDIIHIKFGLDNCAKIVLKRGKLVHWQHLILDFNSEIQDLEQGKMYTYLGLKKVRAYNINN
jgi:hypothetical protein